MPVSGCVRPRRLAAPLPARHAGTTARAARRAARRAAAATVALALVACSGGGGDGNGPTTPPATVASVAITSSVLTELEGRTLTLRAEGRTSGGALVTDAALEWTSLDPMVATVGPAVPGPAGAAWVQTHAGGTARIVAHAVTGAADTAVVTVIPLLVARVVVSDFVLPAALAVGDTGALQAALWTAEGERVSGPSADRHAPTWSVDDPAVATITSGGFVTAHAVGTTIVRATSGTVSGTYPVRVLAAPFRIVLDLDPAIPFAVKSAARDAAREWERLVMVGSSAPVSSELPGCSRLAALPAGAFSVAVRAGAVPAGRSAVATPDCVRTDYQHAGVTIVVGDAFVTETAGSTNLKPPLVLAHEMGHGLGIGTWRYQDPAPKVDGERTVFLGAAATSAWQVLGGTGHPPLQSGDSEHWNSAAGLCSELLAPRVTEFSRLSAVTLGALEDLGWTVRADRAAAWTRSNC